MAAAALLISCASVKPATAPETAKPRGEFPTRSELATLADQPPPVSDLIQDALDPIEWTLTGTLATSFSTTQRTPEGPFESTVETIVRGSPGVLIMTDQLRCVAREIGHFYLARRTRPGAALTRFMGTRCGSTAVQISTRFLQGEAGPDESESQVFKRWQDDFEASLEQGLGDGNQAVGAWYGRESQHAVAVVVTARRRAQIKPFSIVAESGGKVTIEGQVLQAAGSVRGLVNRGRFGVADCDLDGGVRLPRFRFRCTVDPKDERAWLAIVAFPPGRVLGTSVFTGLLWPTTPAPTFRRPVAVRKGVAAEADPRPQLVELINEVRKSASLQPLAYEAQQSDTASEVAPHYFAAAFGRLPATVGDTVALGLRAGWEIEALIRYGRMSSTWLSNTTDLGELVAASVEMPIGREVLLDPDASRLAVGTFALDEQKMLAALFSTYALFDGGDQGAHVSTVLHRINDGRSSRGLNPAVALANLDVPMAEHGRSVSEGKIAPKEALSGMLDEASRILKVGVRGWVVETGSLEDLQIPPELLANGRAQVAVHVVHRRVEGKPWGRYVVFWIVTSAETTA